MMEHLGFEIEQFGPQTYLVRSIPALLSDGDPAAMLTALLDNFEEDESLLRDHKEAKADSPNLQAICG